MPEQAMSTAKDSVAPPGLVICIIGLPYSLVRTDGIPSELMMMWEASELITDSDEPKV